MADNSTDPIADFAEIYQQIHPPLVIAVCLVGSLSHMLLVYILTRKELFNPTNLLLTSFSLSELCLLINYMFITVIMYIPSHYCVETLRNYDWTFTLLLNVNLSVIFHTCGVFHVVIISVMRYLSLKNYNQSSGRTSRILDMKNAALACAFTYIFVPILCTPFYPNSEVAPLSFIDQQRVNKLCRYQSAINKTFYMVKFSNFSLSTGLFKFNFWFFGTFAKLVPCTVVFIMTVLLIHLLRQFVQISRRVNHTGSGQNEKSYVRTTRLVLAVMALFVLVELPQGIVNLLTATLGPDFRENVYQKTGSFFEMLSLVYSSINFALFCLMNSQFRARLRCLVKNILCKKKEVSDTLLNETALTTVVNTRNHSLNTFRNNNTMNCVIGNHAQKRTLEVTIPANENCVVTSV